MTYDIWGIFHAWNVMLILTNFVFPFQLHGIVSNQIIDFCYIQLDFSCYSYEVLLGFNCCTKWHTEQYVTGVGWPPKLLLSLKETGSELICRNCLVLGPTETRPSNRRVWSVTLRRAIKPDLLQHLRLIKSSTKRRWLLNFISLVSMICCVQ